MNRSLRKSARRSSRKSVRKSVRKSTRKVKSPCKKGYVRNPQTNRCRSVKSCPKGYVYKCVRSSWHVTLTFIANPLHGNKKPTKDQLEQHMFREFTPAVLKHIAHSDYKSLENIKLKGCTIEFEMPYDDDYLNSIALVKSAFSYVDEIPYKNHDTFFTRMNGEGKVGYEVLLSKTSVKKV